MPLEKLSQFPLATSAPGVNDAVVGVPVSGNPPNVLYSFAQIATQVGFGGITAWTPTDRSGAALVFTGVAAFYQQIGGLVFVWGTLTYPTTANTAHATISLPIAVPNRNDAQSPGTIAAAGFAGIIYPIKNTTTAMLNDATDPNLTNAVLSGDLVNFSLSYPVA